MLGVKNFITYFIIIFLDLILIVNIVFAFNLQNIMPSVNGINPVDDLSDKYLGISSIIDSFDNFFGNNLNLYNFKSFLDSFIGFINSINLANLLPSYIGGFTEILGIINFLANIAYQFFLIIYGLLLFVYVLSYVVNIFIYIIYLASGQYASDLPNTYAEVYNLAMIPCF